MNVIAIFSFCLEYGELVLGALATETQGRPPLQLEFQREKVVSTRKTK